METNDVYLGTRDYFGVSANIVGISACSSSADVSYFDAWNIAAYDDYSVYSKQTDPTTSRIMP